MKTKIIILTFAVFFMIIGGCLSGMVFRSKIIEINNTITEYEYINQTKYINNTINFTKLINVTQKCPVCAICKCEDVRSLKIRIIGLNKELNQCILQNSTEIHNNLTKKIKELNEQINSFDDRIKEVNDRYKNCTYYQEL